MLLALFVLVLSASGKLLLGNSFIEQQASPGMVQLSQSEQSSEINELSQTMNEVLSGMDQDNSDLVGTSASLETQLNTLSESVEGMETTSSNLKLTLSSIESNYATLEEILDYLKYERIYLGNRWFIKEKEEEVQIEEWDDCLVFWDYGTERVEGDNGYRYVMFKGNSVDL